jgi:hypothetical protein
MDNWTGKVRKTGVACPTKGVRGGVGNSENQLEHCIGEKNILRR